MCLPFLDYAVPKQTLIQPLFFYLLFIYPLFLQFCLFAMNLLAKLKINKQNVFIHRCLLSARNDKIFAKPVFISDISTSWSAPLYSILSMLENG